MYKVDPVTGHGCRDEIVLVYFSEFKYNDDVFLDEIGWADSENESYWLSRIPLIVLVTRLGWRYRADIFYGNLI
jgi:hypothetical protein